MQVVTGMVALYFSQYMSDPFVEGAARHAADDRKPPGGRGGRQAALTRQPFLKDGC
jgi:hypothetical protein